MQASLKGEEEDIHAQGPARISGQLAMFTNILSFPSNSIYVPGVTVRASYLNIEILVDFDDVAKEENVLHQTGEFPHVPQVFEGLLGLGGHLWLCRDIELGLVRRALVARHCREGESRASRTARFEGRGREMHAWTRVDGRMRRIALV